MDSNKLKSRNKIDLKNQLFFLISIPALLATLVMSAGALFLQKEDLHRQFIERGELLTRHFQASAKQHLDISDEESLRSFVHDIINQSGVRAVHVYHISQKQRLDSLSYSGPRMRPPASENRLAKVLGSTHRFQFEIPSPNTSTPVFTEIELDKQVLLLRNYESLYLMLILGVFTALMTFAFAHFASSRFAEPIRSISYAIARIREGHLSTRVSSRVLRGELNELIDGVNTMAASLQSAHEELQSSVDQATADLRSTLETIEIQNIELDFARKEAEQASRIKSQFLANISHEIRTPLNSIIGFANLLLRSSLDAKQKDQLETIVKSSENLLSIINDILDVSKIEAGKLHLEIETVNLRAIVEQVLEALAPLAKDKQLKTRVNIDNDVPETIYSDPLRIQQILTNLVNNAIKFSDEGSLLIRISMLASKSNDGLLKISVKDQGIGLSEKAKEKLFDAFHQSDSSNIRRFQGTGLGLTISRHLVELLGGEIGVDSTLGEGSTFWFTLPCTHSNYYLTLEKSEHLIEENKQSSDYQITPQVLKPRILAVDDNAANLKLICALLEDLDVDYDACETGREAIELNKQHEYDLIFMDIQMPDMDGIEATKKIRAYDKRFSRHRAIVALTAHALEEEKQSFLDFGFNHCLTKPVDMDLLMATIEHWTGYSPELAPLVKQVSDVQINDSLAIDINEGLRLAGNKADLADEMLEMLITGLADDLQDIEKLFAQKQMKNLLDKVHYVHGACRYCGVPRLRAATVAMENALKTGQEAQLQSLLEQMKIQADYLLVSYQEMDKPIHAKLG